MDNNDFKINQGKLEKYTGNGGDAVIPDGVTGIGEEAFLDCRNLRSVTIPDGVTSIGKRAFKDCCILIRVGIPESVTSIERRAFFGCDGLTDVTIPNGVTSIAEGTFFGCRSLKSVTIPDGVTSIADCAFDFCHRLTSVTIPDSVKTIGANAFYLRMKLRVCTLAPTSDDEEQVKMLLNRIGTRNLALPFLLDTLQTSDLLKKKLQSRVTNKTFRGKFIPELIAGGETVAVAKMLSLVKKMEPEEIDRYLGLAENQAEIRALLMEYKNSLYTPAVLEKIEEIQAEKNFGVREKTLADYKKIFSIKKEDGAYVITNCKGEADTVVIPATIRGIPVRISMEKCKTIKNVYLEEGHEKIESDAFSECINLQSITIPSGVTSIGECAFFWCGKLTNVTIPESVTSIGNSAFKFCGNLTSIQFTGTKAQWQAISKDSDWHESVPAKNVVCTDGEVSL